MGNNTIDSLVFCGALINNLQDAIIVLDSGGAIRFANRAAERLFGASSEEILGQSFGVPVASDTASEIEIVSNKGPIRLAEIKTSEIFHENQSWTLCALRDVSVREVTEQRSLAIEAADLGLWEWNAKYDVVKYDSRSMEILELGPEDHRGDLEDFQLRIHPDDLSRVMESWEAHNRGLTPSFEAEYRTLTGSGKYKTVLNRARVNTRDETGKPVRIFGALFDMSQHQRSLETERASSVQYRFVLDNIPIPIMLVNKNGDLIHSNRKLRQMFDFAPQVYGKPVNVFQNTLFTQSGINRLLHETLIKASKTSSELTYTPGKEKSRTLKCFVAPTFDPEGQVSGCQVLIEDITDNKRAQKVLTDNEKLKAIAELASGVAHSFNNMLQIVVGSSNLAIGHIQKGNFNEVEPLLQKVLDNAKLGAGTVRRLQDFAGISVPSRSSDFNDVFDLADAVSHAIEMSRPWWKINPQLKGINIDLERRLENDLYVKGHEDDLLEVTINLIKNATDAMPQGGRLLVSARRQNSKVLLEIEDTGIGISKENQEKIFRPFWTTKGFQSSGLGLPGSLGIVRRYGGSISVSSQEGNGSIFTVTLPLHGEELRKLPPSSDGEKREFRILCVDDDVTILEVLKEGFEMHGHSVETAINGHLALEQFRTNDFDLVICDLGMPEMTGWEVGTAIKNLCLEKRVPKTPFFMLTGWGGQTEDKKKIRDSGVDAVFTKPISLSELLDLMNRYLDGN